MPLPSPINLIRPYSTGASFVYMGLGQQKAPLCFGTCEGYPKHNRTTEYMEARNDISGRRLPMDMSFQGQRGSLSLDMTVWDEGMAQMLERIPDISGMTNSANDPGTWDFSDVGALMGLEGLSIPIWVRYTFGGVTASSRFSGSAINPGYHYFNAIPMEMGDENGAQAQVRQFTFFIWAPPLFGSQKFKLFDRDMSAVLSVPINGPDQG